MASITRAGGPSNWRDVFLSHPGLAVTPENWELLTAEAAAPEAAAAPEPEAGPDAAPAPKSRKGSLT